MEAYKRWVRQNKDYVHSLESLANVSLRFGFTTSQYYFVKLNVLILFLKIYLPNSIFEKGHAFVLLQITIY